MIFFLTFLIITEINNIFEDFKLFKRHREPIYVFNKSKFNFSDLILFIFIIIVIYYMVNDLHNGKSLELNLKLILFLIYFFIIIFRGIIRSYAKEKEMFSNIGVHTGNRFYDWIRVKSYIRYKYINSYKSKRYQGIKLFIYRRKLSKIINGEELEVLHIHVPKEDVEEVELILDNFIIKEFF